MGVTLVLHWCPAHQRLGGSDHRFQSLYDPLYPIQVCLATSMVLCTQFYWLDKLSLLLPHTATHWHYTAAQDLLSSQLFIPYKTAAFNFQMFHFALKSEL